MSRKPPSNLAALSMPELFRLEVENQSEILTEGLLALERKDAGATGLEALMRAAHSMKGAARLVGLASAVKIAHAMEDCLVAAQADSAILTQGRIDMLLRGVDLLARIANESPSIESPSIKSDSATVGDADVETFLRDLSAP